MTLKEFIKSLRVGDAKKFAARLGVSPSYLSQMASGRTAISPTRALMIESATEGQVSRAELRPHDWELIWPEYASSIRLGQTHVVHAEGDCSACLSDGVDS